MVKSNRIAFLDYLRVCSIFFVIMIHVATQNLWAMDVNSFAWQTFNFYDCLSRWCVPVFVMISGALFLTKTITISQIYKKYILRLLISFFCLEYLLLFIGSQTVIMG